MTLLYRFLFVVVTAGCLASACGTDSFNSYHGTAQTADGGSMCDALCRRVWHDCGGLPAANYQLGHSNSDCITGCPAYLDRIGKIRDPDVDVAGMYDALDCVAYQKHSCEELAKDYCEMDEGDLFSKYATSRH